MKEATFTKEQEAINAHWSKGASNYNDIIDVELDSFRGAAWTKQILDQMPAGKQLKILDCGCGPGFFSTLMAMAGHTVTGIDGSEDMLNFAKDRAHKRNLDIEFLLMDCHDLLFDDNTFDLVLSRNVTHALRDHKQVYKEWKRVLKPGATLLIFDANWHLTRPEGPEAEESRRRYRECLQVFGSDFSGNIWDGSEEHLEALCKPARHAGDEIWNHVLKDKRRPDWDLGLLEGLNFDRISCDRDITGHLWDDKEKLIYGNTPMFMISARKPVFPQENYEHASSSISSTSTESSLESYWKHRSDTYSIQNLTDMNSWKKLVWRDLILSNAGKKEDGQILKILDVGTGPGFFAINLALAGHDVTAIDLTDDMLNHARENAMAYQAKVDFSLQLADQLTFADETFDLVINRNVVWNLERPEEALKEWRRVLKKGGRMIYFDANWYIHLFHEDLAIKWDTDKEEWKKKYGFFANGHPGVKNEKHNKKAQELEQLAKEKLPLSPIKRPEWDFMTLTKLDMEIVELKQSVNDLIYDEGEQLYYRHMPMFMVVAEKR